MVVVKKSPKKLPIEEILLARQAEGKDAESVPTQVKPVETAKPSNPTEPTAKPKRPIPRRTEDLSRLSLRIKSIKDSKKIREAVRREVRWLYSYSSDRVLNYPRRQKQKGYLGATMIQLASDIMSLNIEAEAFDPDIDREATYRRLVRKCKELEEYIVMSRERGYIKPRNEDQWMKIVAGLEGCYVGFAMALQRRREKAALEKESNNDACKVKNEASRQADIPKATGSTQAGLSREE